MSVYDVFCNSFFNRTFEENQTQLNVLDDSRVPKLSIKVLHPTFVVHVARDAEIVISSTPG